MSHPRLIRISYTVSIDFEIPEDFPLKADQVQRVVDWKTNDHCDGRMPFTTETMMHAAGEAAHRQLNEAIFQHYARRIDASFGRGQDHMEARDKLVARLSARVRAMGVAERELDVKARIFEAMVTCPACGFDSATRHKSCTCGAVLP